MSTDMAVIKYWATSVHDWTKAAIHWAETGSMVDAEKCLNQAEDRLNWIRRDLKAQAELRKRDLPPPRRNEQW